MLCPNEPAAAGFDFNGGSYVGVFVANKTSVDVNISIVADLRSDEGTEYFLVQLSPHMSVSDLEGIAVSMGNIREATVYIDDEIIISFSRKNVQVKEGGNLTLTVTASTATNMEFNITVNITGIDIHMSCELIQYNTLHSRMQ